jgi:hypothetical protein
MKLLDHELIISSYNEHMMGTGIAYMCINCNAEITLFNSDHSYFIWHIGRYINLISCDEYIIKSIIE